MRMFGLTELGHVLKLEVTDGDPKTKPKTKIINDAIVLDTDNSTFSIEYNPNKYGDLVMETITENPKDIYDRISRARVELDKRELAFMAHLFLVEKDDYTVDELTKTEEKKKRVKREKPTEPTPEEPSLKPVRRRAKGASSDS